MANRRITFNIGANIKDFQKGLKSAQRSLRRFGRKMKSAGATMSQTLTLPIVAAGAASVVTAAKFETLQKQLEVLTGSAEAGAKIFKQLTEYAANTPFELQPIAKAQRTLMGFGLATDEAFQSLKMIGDIAALTGGDMQAIAVAFGQAAAEGRLMTRDIRQLINQGVPAIELLADTMNVATSDVLDLASQGKISFEILTTAFRNATSEGGKFADGAEQLAETTAGVFSTMVDDVRLALGDLGKTLIKVLDIKDLMRGVSDAVETAVSWFNNLTDSGRKTVLIVAGITAAIGPLLFILGSLSAAIGAISLPVTAVVLAVGAAVAGIIAYWDELAIFFTTNKTFLELKESAQELWRSIKVAFNEGTELLISIWNEWGDELITGAKIWLDSLMRIFGTLFKTITAILHLFAGEWKAAWADMIDAAASIVGSLKPVLAATMKAQALMIREGLKNNKKLAKQFASEVSGIIAGANMPDKEMNWGLNIDGAELPNLMPKIDTSGLEKYKVAVEDMRSAVAVALGMTQKEWDQYQKKVASTLEATEGRFSSGMDALKQIGSQAVSMLGKMFGQMATSLGSNIGRAIAGVGNSFATGFEKVILIVLDFAKQLAGVLGAIGGILLLTPFAGVGAGLLAAAAALSALAAGFTAGINKRIENREQRAQENNIPGMAMGGIVPAGFPNDTYPAMLSSGETVIPSPKPLPSMGGGRVQVIENVINLDGKTIYRNQKRVENGYNR